jgi:tyrosyl-DNA phosphodiesterase 1
VGLSDLLDGDFSQCLLTNYMYDMAWLFGACPRLHDVPVVLVHGERDRAAMAAECRGFPNVTLVAPRLPIPYGTHHTKMMVIVYATHVRVVICTANFIAIDWNNKTQGVWTQDFPLAQAAASPSSSSPAHPSSSSVVDFERDLIDYLSTLGTAVVDFCGQLRRFDFSAAEVALIPSVPGVHTGKGTYCRNVCFLEIRDALLETDRVTGADMDKYGHLRVRKCVRNWS